MEIIDVKLQPGDLDWSTRSWCRWNNNSTRNHSRIDKKHHKQRPRHRTRLRMNSQLRDLNRAQIATGLKMQDIEWDILIQNGFRLSGMFRRHKGGGRGVLCPLFCQFRFASITSPGEWRILSVMTFKIISTNSHFHLLPVLESRRLRGIIDIAVPLVGIGSPVARNGTTSSPSRLAEIIGTTLLK